MGGTAGPKLPLAQRIMVRKKHLKMKPQRVQKPFQVAEDCSITINKDFIIYT